VRRPDDRAHDGEWRARRLEHRALLDVQLDECVDSSRAAVAILAGSRPRSRIAAATSTSTCRLFGDPRVSPEIRREARAFSSQIATTSSGRFGLPLSFSNAWTAVSPATMPSAAVEPAPVANRVDV